MDVPGVLLLVLVFVAITFFSSKHRSVVAARKKFMAGAGGVIVFALAGGVLGGGVGFLFRPSLPFIGKPQLRVVLGGGSGLSGMDLIWASTAKESFDYLLIGALLGTALFGIGRASMPQSSSRTPNKAPASASMFPKVAPLPSPKLPPTVATLGSSISVPGRTGTPSDAFCTKCGTALRNEVQFCGKCGTRRG